jgi:predicted RNase H-like HicB family nuclease
MTEKTRPAPPRPAIELEQKADGRWIAAVTASPGCLAYGATPQEALAAVLALQTQIATEAATWEHP